MFGLMRARTCVKHTETWRAWRNHYCGTCKTIGARYGQAARMALNHDTVFLAELLTALRGGAPDWSRAYRSFNCMALPKRDDEMPEVLRYSAAATLVLAEFKVADHIEDTGRRRWRGLARLFSRAFRKAEKDLLAVGFPMPQLRKALRTQSARERSETTIAEFAAPTAEATKLFFAHGAVVAGLPDEAAGTLADLGQQFGELAYWIDALEDYGKDRTSGAFNAIRSAYRLDPSQELPPDVKREVVAQLQSLTRAIRHDLERLPVPPDVAESFGARLQANLDAKLGLRVCVPRQRAPVSRTQSWQDALAFARRISNDAPRWRMPLTVAAVALVAYFVPSHSRAAATPSECFSLGLNLMALGSVFAMAVGPPVDPAPVAGAKTNKGKGSGSGSCGDCDCCCDCPDAGCCACEACSCDACGGCCECGSCCDCGGCDC